MFLKILSNSKDKTIRGVLGDSVAIINSKDGIKNALMNKTNSHTWIYAQVLTINKITKITTRVTPAASIHKYISL